MAERIAVIGMACRYPEADSPHRLWQNVMARRRSFRPLPPGRLPLAEYGGDGADQTYVTHAGLISDWTFDRPRFGVAGPTFRAVDTTHWLALDVSAAALADAGFPDGDGLDRTRAGVVLGNSLTGEFSRAATLRTRWPYVRRSVLAALAGSAVPADEQAGLIAAIERAYKAPFPEPSDETLSGALANTIAGRVCNHFDFHGFGYTVDGACASSLLAVSTAATALADGRLEVALAGGVDLSLDPFELVGFARVGALARGGMRVYDRRPTGFLPGEGCGVLVLCRESFARDRGLRTYGHLLGWGMSSDGSGGLTRPESAGQGLALRRAYEHARLDCATVSLIEGHGTGTAVGDQAELEALRELRRGAGRAAALGSIKANIGHTKAAAGVAGLLKAVLAVHHGVLPPTTGCAEPHPLLTAPGAGLEILDEARPWPAGRRHAAVSAMGFGGINVHVVVGGTASARRRRLAPAHQRLAAPHPSHEVVVCAAADRAELAAKLTRIAEVSGTLTRGELGDLAATLAGTTVDAPYRFAAAVAGPDELAAAVRQARDHLAAGGTTLVDPPRRVFLGGPDRLRVAVLFPGQAAPCYSGPGALGQLLAALPPGYDEKLPLPDDPHTTVGTDAAQPAIVRGILAGLRWLAAIGADADQAAGHSLGEIGALVWAGALREADAYLLARARGAAMAEADPGRAGMANLQTDPDTAAGLLRGTDVVIAADNGERRTVVSGGRAEVGRVIDAAARAGIGATWLPVAHAFHSPAMEPAAPRLKAAAAALGWRPVRRPVASTVTGDWLAGEDLVELLVRQLTTPVRFAQALGRLSADLFVEVGPGRMMAGLAGPTTVSLDAGSPSAEGAASVTAALFAAGRCGTLTPWFAGRFTRPYALDRDRLLLTNPCEAVPGAPSGPEPAAGRPAGPDADDGDPLSVAVACVAEALELDADTIAPDARLLAELHLSSLRVTQIATAVAARLGRAMPAAPLSLSTATVRELAETVAGLPAADQRDAPPAGVAGWVRAFAPLLVPQPPPEAAPVARAFTLVGDLTGHPLADEIRAAFGRSGDETPAGDATPAYVLALPPWPAQASPADVVTALRSAHRDRAPLVVVHHGGVGAAVGRSLAAEEPRIPVLVVEAPADPAGVARAAAEARREPAPYAEVVLTGDGRRAVPAMAPVPLGPADPGRIPLGPGEVCVVTGGAKGIGAECAVALAELTGARMVLLGRTPGTDPAVRATLSRLPDAVYHAVDITDGVAVAAALDDVRRRHGRVRALLHAAGQNVPVLIPDLDVTAMHTAAAAKTDGFDRVLAALDLGELRFAVTFGSVIARTGLAGEAHYAVANEWLARRCIHLAAEHPGVRWLNIEWSAWSGAGMGVRLGVLDGLIRRGLDPIPVDAGVATLLRLLSTPDLPPTVLVTGRLPSGPVLRWHGGEGVTGRFPETPLVHTPATELVAAADVSTGTDPYLSDHRIDGAAVLPAVMGLEAMAQCAGVLIGDTGPAQFTGVRLSHPVTVPDRDRRTLRVAALTRDDGAVDVVVRSDETGFATDHFTARYGGPVTAPVPAAAALPGSEMPAAHLYGPLFFHGPRFRRVRGYRAIGAYRCVGVVDAGSREPWFSAFLDQRLRLGDAGARDAFLHLLQACVPDRLVLPVGVDRIHMHRPPAGRLIVAACQRSEDASGFVFDLTVTDPAGTPVEDWTGLRLRAVRALDLHRWPLEVAGAYLTRSLARRPSAPPVDLVTARADRSDPAHTAAVASWLTGTPVTHADDGRLVTAGAGGVSASHLGDRLLVAAGPGRIGVDWAWMGEVAPPLSSADTAVAAEAAQVATESAATAAFRIWTCREVLGKLGEPPSAPLTVAETRDGWTTFRSGDVGLHSIVLAGTASPVAICVGVG
ncbi:type I polyketide synthase [Couchioplanes caeruleus]|uniref:Enediyne polyketide synthase n=2 Tax=Couchioplanes caeruleus TaxID=56438 RepID=A0A1K0GXS2_9ACTN|nr:type I polyketide synthase [Couchioplanes caeruleus]OJF16228.1 Enediyne polyketide synthase [Couchioplanes caeruleus subsp. caeruleus]ROP28779.1 enediyne polyketide synthase [Couchioplanes caeruleus]